MSGFPAPSGRGRRRGQPRRRRRALPGARVARARRGRRPLGRRRGQRFARRRSGSASRARRRRRASIGFSANLGFAGARQRGDRADARALRAAAQQRRRPGAGLRRAAGRAARLDDRLAAAQGLVLSEDGTADRHGRARVERAGARRCPCFRGADASAAPREPFEVSGRLGDGDALPPRGARGRGAAGRGVRRAPSSPTTRTWTCRCASPGRAGGSPAIRARSRATRARARPADAVAARVLDGAQPLADAVPQLRARRSSRATCAPLLRADLAHVRAVGWRARAAAARLAAAAVRGAGASRRASRAGSRGGRARRRPMIREDHGDLRLLEGRRGRSLEAVVGRSRQARARMPRGGVARLARGRGQRRQVWRAGGAPTRCGRTRRSSSTRRTAASVPRRTRRPPRRAGDVLLFLNPDTRAEGEPFTPIARALRRGPATSSRSRRGSSRWTAVRAPAAAPLRLAPPGRRGPGDVSAAAAARRSARDARELLLIDHLAPEQRRAAAARATPTRTADAAFPVEQAAAAALAVRRGRVRAGRRLRRALRSRLVRGRGPVRAARPRRDRSSTCPDAAFRHRGGDSASRLGYDRFLPVFYRNALRYRARATARPARAAYRALLAAGMAAAPRRCFRFAARFRAPGARRRAPTSACSAWRRVCGRAGDRPPPGHDPRRLDRRRLEGRRRGPAGLARLGGRAAGRRRARRSLVDNASSDGSREVAGAVRRRGARSSPSRRTWASRRR